MAGAAWHCLVVSLLCAMQATLEPGQVAQNIDKQQKGEPFASLQTCLGCLLCLWGQLHTGSCIPDAPARWTVESAGPS